MKRLVQVSSTMHSLGRIHSVYQMGVGGGGKGRTPTFLDVIERLSICNIITTQVKFLIF